MTPTIDGPRMLADLHELARIGASESGGVNRIAYSAADRAGRDLVAARLAELGCEVTVDAAGNTIARYPGLDPALPAIALGSHTDSVPEGGLYDGALGVVAAIACVRALAAAATHLRRPLEVLNFACEEATMSGGTLGSRAMAGLWDPEILDQPAFDGRPVREHIAAAGIDTARIAEAERPRGSLAAYLELHIEQGGTLEADGVDVGVVEGIVGIRRYGVSFEGVANHAGTTPMALRRDALVAAAPFITDVRELAIEGGIVGTVGTLQVLPGASNVIPGRVELSCELRSLDEAALDAAEARLLAAARSRGGRPDLLSAKEPVASAPRLLAVIEAACEESDLTHRRMPSGAGHDGMSVAQLCEVAMLFVPSRGGVSHSPLEFTEPLHCVAGARALLAALLRLDSEPGPTAT